MSHISATSEVLHDRDETCASVGELDRSVQDTNRAAAQLLVEGDAPLTVLNISQNYYVRGGSDRYFFVLSELLEAHGHQVIPFTSAQAEDEETPWSRYFPRGIDFRRPSVMDLLRFIYSPRARRSLKRLLAEQQPDLAHLHIYYGQLTASIFGPLRQAGVPIIQTIHDFKLVCPVYSLLSHGQICEACQGKHFYKAVTRRCNRGSLLRSTLSATESYASRLLGAGDYVDHFISVSNFQRDKLVELGLPAEKITVVHNYKDTTDMPVTTTEGDYLLFFGRLERLKGIYTLLDAAAAVSEARIVLAGDGDATDEVRDIIQDRGLKNVEMVGFARGAQLEALIRGSVATILPSLGYDNCPMSVLESLAYGRPVIGSRIGGIPELVDHEQDGLLVTPGDSDSLAEALRWMNDHRAEAVQMGQRGRAKIEERFNPEIHYQKVRQVYREVLKSSAPAALRQL